MSDLLDVNITGTGELGKITAVSVSNSSITKHSSADPTPPVATVSVTGRTTGTSQFLSGNLIAIEDLNGLGQTSAVVDTVSVSNSTTTISGPNNLSRFLTGNINIPAVFSGTAANALDLAMQLSGERRASNTYTGGSSENTATYTLQGHSAGFGTSGQLLDFPDTTHWSAIVRAGTLIDYPQSVSYSPPLFGVGFQSALTGQTYASNPAGSTTDEAMRLPLDDPTRAGIFNFIFPKDSPDSASFAIPTGRALFGYLEGDLSPAYLGFDYEESNNRFKLFYESVASPGENADAYISTLGLTGDEWLVSLRFYFDASYNLSISMAISDTDGSNKVSSTLSVASAPDAPVLLWVELPAMRMVRTDSIPSAWTGWDDPYEIPTAADIQISNDLFDTPISGMTGVVWDYLNQVCAAHNVEVAVVNGVITLRTRGLLDIDVAEFTQAPVISPISNKAEKVSLGWSEFVPNPPIDVGIGGVNLFTNPSFETASGSVVSTVVANNCSTLQSSDWVASGLFSMKLSPTSTNDSYAALKATNIITSPLMPGTTYTVLATVRLAAAQTGSLSSLARSIVYVSSVGGTVSSSQATNAAGVTSLSLTFTVNPAETSASVRLYNGASSGNGDVWWDDVLLIEGNYAGGYFDGSTPATDSARYYWTSTANSSTSQWMKRIPNVFGVYDVPGTYQVDVGSTQEIFLDTPNYYSGLIQPRPRAVAAMLPPSILSGYAVSGSDNLPIDPTEWLDYGGSLRVETTNLYGQIRVILTGPNIEIPGVPGPYSFSASDGETSYPLIRIPYTGIQFAEPLTTTTATGAAPSSTTQVEPVSITNVCATSWGLAWEVLASGAKNFAGPRTTVTLTIPTQKAQEFGLAEGSLFRVRNGSYRVMNVTYNVGTASVTALPYNTYDMFEEAWLGKTYDDFATLWGDEDYTYEDFSISPLTTEW